MTEPCRFDDSVPRLLRVLAKHFDANQIAAGVVLRDIAGQLSFFAGHDMAPAEREALAEQIRAELGPYARPDRVIVNPDEPGARRMLEATDALALRITTDDVSRELRYVDRRIVGADWLRAPMPSAIAEHDRSTPSAEATPSVERRPPRRVAFSSLKGGVGRSTALTIVAAEQARRGRDVLVVDLDLEAPGIGSLLLSDDRAPRYGVIDFLVERNFGAVDRAMLGDMVGTSALTQGQGLVSVVPAVGSRTVDEPGNYLAKLSRAMIEAVPDDGDPVSLAGKLREMLVALESVRGYDLVLIDVRAGLAELTAGPLLALGSEVLIFGTDQRQTFQDLQFLLAHLASLTRATRPDEWNRLKMVHAKASSAARIEAFRDEVWDLFSTYLYVEAVDLEQFNFDADATEAPHYPIVIRLDTGFVDWDPVSHPDKLVESFYADTFGHLLRYIDDLLAEDSPDA